MPQRIPKTLAGPGPGTGSAVTVYSPSSGVRGVIRQIHFACSGAVGTTSSISASKGGMASGTLIVPSTATIDGGDVKDFFFQNLALVPGEILQIKCDSNVTYLITGEEYVYV